MSVIKTYKYRLKLSKEQRYTIDSYINTSRAVYNLALETKMYAYQNRKVSLSKYDLMKQLTECRAEFDWIREVPCMCLQEAIEQMDKAYQSFFKGGGFPNWARKDRFNSVTFKSIALVNDNVFRLPKFGTVTVFKDRHPKGELRRATITRNNGKYYLSVVTRQEREEPIVKDNNQVGIDMGISFFATLSTGGQIENPRHTLKYERRLRVLQRSLARKKKVSKSRDLAKLKVSKMNEKLRNTRNDFLQKESTKIVNRFSLIAVEDLKVSNMVKNPHLSKHISDASWSEFFKQLEYKSNWYGNEFVKVDPKHTSQTCNDCGAVDRKSRISQSTFVCTSCGAESNADVNASKNILGRGTLLVREREALA